MHVEDSDECYEEESASDTADEEIPLENQPEPELEMAITARRRPACTHLPGQSQPDRQVQQA
jgi:hypothetical protein